MMIRLIVALTLLALQPAARPTSASPSIVFVCEHGAAKSVIATAYFNKLAAERGLPYRATFRGTSPQDDLSVRAVAGLRQDGIAVPSGKPAAISDGDIASATHIFAIGCTLPDRASRSGKADDWSDVPDDQGYGPMRDAIVRHVKSLLDRLVAGQRNVPSVQYRSPEGVEYRSLPDTDAVKNARAALDADPKSITKIIDLGVAQSGARQFREAIATFTRGLEIEPANALLLRWRGHRYLSVREFDRAFADLTRGGAIDSTIYGIWYHLGVVQYLRGSFAEAAASFARAQPIAPDAGELAGSTDWLWMSLSRAGRGADAKAMLDRRPDSKPVTNAYTRRLQLYRGEIGPDAVLTPADTDDVQVATLAYGLGNWYLVRGDTAQARRWFERSIQSGGWPAFGFIVSEVELRRLR